jgi:flagellar biosynthetic protein FliP
MQLARGRHVPRDSGGGLCSGSYRFGDAARRPGHQHQFRPGASGGGLNERIIQLIALTVLSPAPAILDDNLVHPHRGGAVAAAHALGTATSPPNSVIISVALFLTAFVMGPVLTRVYNVGKKLLVANEISVNEAFDGASGPLRGFMEKNVRDKDLRLLVGISAEAQPQKPDDLSMRVLVPAFMMWSPRC